MSTKSKLKFKTIKDGQEVFPSLYKMFRLGCCDCGLIHNMDFTIYKNGKVVQSPTKKGYRVSLTPYRDNIGTSILRKRMINTK